jgi:hypothetical protein
MAMKSCLAFLLLMITAHESHAACPQTPMWAKGRDPATCQLLVEGGSSYGMIRFDQEKMQFLGPGNSYQPAGPGAKDVAGGCPTSNLAVWSSKFDNYSAGTKKQMDVSHMNTNSNAKFVLIRDSLFTNAWVCKGGAWSGPNGLSCAAGETSDKHSDLLQIFGLPKDNGWVVLQNTDLLNGDQQIGIWQTPSYQRGAYSSSSPRGICADPAGTGGMLWQNVRYGNPSSSFKSDCLARGNARWACAGGNQFVIKGDTGFPFGDVWLVGVQNLSGARFRVMSDVPKIVVIGGSGGRNGWPGPLGPGPSVGPGTCPNGKLPGKYNESGTVDTAVYCYSSIESAIAAGHRPPPFLNLSATGWKTAPSGSADPSATTALLAPELRFGD